MRILDNGFTNVSKRAIEGLVIGIHDFKAAIKSRSERYTTCLLRLDDSGTAERLQWTGVVSALKASFSPLVEAPISCHDLEICVVAELE